MTNTSFHRFFNPNPKQRLVNKNRENLAWDSYSKGTYIKKKHGKLEREKDKKSRS